MRIKMLKTRLGCENGYDVHIYKQGEIYLVGEALGAFFLWRGFAQKLPPSSP